MSQAAPSTSTVRDDIEVKCELCSQPRFFKGLRGLRIHVSRAHKSENLQLNSTPTDVQNVTDAPPSNITLSLWQKLSFLKHSRPLLKKIPRGARTSVATALGKCIENAVKLNNAESWERLLIFPYITLFVDRRERNDSSLTHKIKSNCTNPSPINYNSTFQAPKNKIYHRK